jgi:hypothetical protein
VLKSALTTLTSDLVNQVRAADLFSRPIGKIGRLATRVRRIRGADAGRRGRSNRGNSITVAVISSF